MAASRFRGSNITNLSFNQDHDCFICSMEDGLKVYNLDPLVEKTKIDFSICGSVSFATMLHRSNLIALVGGGQAAKFPDTQVMIWDDKLNRFIYRLTFRSKVVKVQMKPNLLAVVLEQEIHIFSFPQKVELRLSLDTPSNPRGIFECTTPLHQDVLFYLSTPTNKCSGTIKVQDISPEPKVNSITIPAHQHPIATIAINSKGTYIATASKKGTLIRLRDVTRNELLAEFRRGSDTAYINSLSFSPDSAYLCAGSDKGTVHIFAVQKRELNKKSNFAGSGISKWYTESQWGMAQVSLVKEVKFVATLDKQPALHILTWDGGHFKYHFNPNAKNNHCHHESYDLFTTVGDDLC